MLNEIGPDGQPVKSSLRHTNESLVGAAASVTTCNTSLTNTTMTPTTFTAGPNGTHFASQFVSEPKEMSDSTLSPTESLTTSNIDLKEQQSGDTSDTSNMSQSQPLRTRRNRRMPTTAVEEGLATRSGSLVRFSTVEESVLISPSDPTTLATAKRRISAVNTGIVDDAQRYDPRALPRRSTDIPPPPPVGRRSSYSGPSIATISSLSNPKIQDATTNLDATAPQLSSSGEVTEGSGLEMNRSLSTSSALEATVVAAQAKLMSRVGPMEEDGGGVLDDAPVVEGKEYSGQEKDVVGTAKDKFSFVNLFKNNSKSSTNINNASMGSSQVKPSSTSASSISTTTATTEIDAATEEGITILEHPKKHPSNESSSSSSSSWSKTYNRIRSASTPPLPTLSLKKEQPVEEPHLVASLMLVPSVRVPKTTSFTSMLRDSATDIERELKEKEEKERSESTIASSMESSSAAGFPVGYSTVESTPLPINNWSIADSSAGSLASPIRVDTTIDSSESESPSEVSDGCYTLKDDDNDEVDTEGADSDSEGSGLTPSFADVGLKPMYLPAEPFDKAVTPTLSRMGTPTPSRTSTPKPDQQQQQQQSTLSGLGFAFPSLNRKKSGTASTVLFGKPPAHGLVESAERILTPPKTPELEKSKDVNNVNGFVKRLGERMSLPTFKSASTTETKNTVDTPPSSDIVDSDGVRPNANGGGFLANIGVSNFGRSKVRQQQQPSSPKGGFSGLMKSAVSVDQLKSPKREKVAEMRSNDNANGNAATLGGLLSNFGRSWSRQGFRSSTPTPVATADVNSYSNSRSASTLIFSNPASMDGADAGNEGAKGNTVNNFLSGFRRSKSRQGIKAEISAESINNVPTTVSSDVAPSAANTEKLLSSNGNKWKADVSSAVGEAGAHHQTSVDNIIVDDDWRKRANGVVDDAVDSIFQNSITMSNADVPFSEGGITATTGERVKRTAEGIYGMGQHQLSRKDVDEIVNEVEEIKRVMHGDLEGLQISSSESKGKGKAVVA
jgi:hypothetical protein